MTEIILFGRSQFINKIDVPALCLKYKTIGMNFFSEFAPVDYNFCFLDYVPAKFPNTKTFTRYVHEQAPPEVERVRYIPQREPFLTKEYDEKGRQKLALRAFSSSAAINWAILEGYKQIYFIGVDHVETQNQPEHFDGKDGSWSGDIKPIVHQNFKEFVYECCFYFEIFINSHINP